VKRTWRGLLGGVLLAMVLASAAPPATVCRADLRETLRNWVRPGGAPSTQPTATAPAEDAPADAEGLRVLLLRGKYAAAERAYRKLLDEQGASVAASLGLAEALRARGRYAEALETLDAVGEQAADDARWHVARAELLATVGKYEQALSAAHDARKLRRDWMPALRVEGRLLETLGRTEEARAVYKSAEAAFAGEEYRNDAESLVAAGMLLDRYSILTSRKASEQARNILHNYLQKAYEVDRTYWPAHEAAGMFLLSKHRPDVAAKEFALAAKLNGAAAEVHVGLGAVALGQWNFEQCLKHAADALKTNPHHADALLLKAICLMQWRKFEEVPAVLDRMLKTNPNHLEALSLYAALHVRQDEPEKSEPYAKRVGEINARFSGLPGTIADWLSAARRFDLAERYYRKAIELEPYSADPLAGLGKVYMQTGQEAEAKAVLEKAYALDDYRKDVVNYLKLLAKLDKFLTRETEHFIVKVDAKRDAVLLDQVAEYMEKIHAEICEDFGHEPPGKTIIEILPTHADFSVRVTGRGWIGTIGACTGNVIALAAPTPEQHRSPFGTHNWAVVLRHEYTHTVTLSATGNRIPHWFTEACAVWQQPDRQSHQAVQQLIAATRAGKLMPISKLDWGFVRPEHPGQRSLAYAQSEWIMEYVIETKGYAAILRMLEGFAAGRTQKEVFAEVLATDEKTFDKQFRQWAKRQLAAWGYSPAPLPDVKKTTKLAAANPQDANAQADHAVALYLRRQFGPAETHAQKALKLDDGNPRALAVMASICSAKDRHDDSLRYAEKLRQADPDSKIAPRVMAKAHLAKREWAKAIHALELLKLRQPMDPFSYKELANKYMQIGQPEKALPNLLELHRRTMTDQKYARQIADIYRVLGREQDALDYYRQVLHINPYETSAYDAIAAIERNAGRYEQAIRAGENVCLLSPDSANAWAQMAMLRYLAGRDSRDIGQLGLAKEAAEKSLTLEPSSRVERLLRTIDRAME